MAHLSLACVTTGIMQLTTLYTFGRLQVGPSLALFQLSALISVFLGYRYFQEQHIRRRLLGAAVMVAGAAMISGIERVEGGSSYQLSAISRQQSVISSDESRAPSPALLLSPAVEPRARVPTVAISGCRVPQSRTPSPESEPIPQIAAARLDDRRGPLDADFEPSPFAVTGGLDREHVLLTQLVEQVRRGDDGFGEACSAKTSGRRSTRRGRAGRRRRTRSSARPLPS